MTPLDHEHWHHRADEPLRVTVVALGQSAVALSSPCAALEDVERCLRQIDERAARRQP